MSEDEAAKLVSELVAYKDALDMTWVAVAEDVGVSPSSLANWRSEEVRPTGKNLVALRKWCKRIARKLEGQPGPDQGTAVSYVVHVNTPTGCSGVVPNAEGLRDILVGAGLRVAVQPLSDANPPSFSVDEAIRGAVREELRAALANGVQLSL